jgi:hypothetical protein
VLAAFCIGVFMAWISHARLALFRPALAFGGALGVALVLVGWEDSGRAADRRKLYAAEIWTDEALGSLPHGSVVLVRTPPIAWRLWASHLARGARPDLIVVPTALLDRPSVAAHLLELEPALDALIREVGVSGRPTEYALSSLADARPLFVEFDPAWDPRLLDHLVPRTFWLRFAPHALGRSDRARALESSRRAFARVYDHAADPARPDAATLSVLYHRGREQALTLAALGDRSSVRRVLADLTPIHAAEPFVVALRERLKDDSRGGVDVTGLLE